jgi:E3 ubiquitin-protein ligase RNF19A
LENEKIANEIHRRNAHKLNSPVNLNILPILSLLGKRQYEEFSRIRELVRLRNDPDCRWCPNEECSAGMLSKPTDPDFPRLECRQCGCHFCFECSQFWHPGLTCAKGKKQLDKALSKQRVSRRKRSEKEMKRWLKENKSFVCSNCTAVVQKMDGCNHMTCHCGREFCWVCGETIISSFSHFSLGACAGLQHSSTTELSLFRQVARVALAPIRVPLSVPARIVSFVQNS